MCNNCKQFSPPAAKICKHDSCGVVFPSKSFNWNDIENMGKTNPTNQRELLEKRVISFCIVFSVIMIIYLILFNFFGGWG